jgi:hypothetical protein
MTRLLEIAPGRVAHASGALWLPEIRAVLIADAHLGYGWAQRRRGELGPLRDDLARAKLDALVDELAPREIVFLGDVVHAPRPGADERALIEDTLSSLAERLQLTLVRGNHDRAFQRDFAGLGIPLAGEWSGGGVVALHGDRPHEQGGAGAVFGHLHPSLTIEDAAGARQRVPVFLVGSDAIVLPAFSPFAAGIDLARPVPRAAARLLPAQPHGYAATGKRVVPLGPIRIRPSRG